MEASSSLPTKSPSQGFANIITSKIALVAVESHFRHFIYQEHYLGFSHTAAKMAVVPYKAAFLQACLDGKVLSFGTYKLKSGRESPYFFNAGLFLDSASLFRSVQTAYAQCIISHAHDHPDFSFDVLFGVSTF